MKIWKLIGTTCVATFAFSATADDFSFKYSANEVNSSKGVESIYKSIEQTAKEHCPSWAEVRSLADVRSCREDVANTLVQKINAPLLTAYHNGETTEQIASR